MHQVYKLDKVKLVRKFVQIYSKKMANSALTSYPKDKIKILFLENISDAAIKVFRDAGYTDIKKVSGALSEEQLIEEIKNVHLVGIRSKTQMTKRVIDNAPKLQAIGCFCIGTNQVNLSEARKKGIVVFNAPYSNTRSVAELVIGLHCAYQKNSG
jgi:D-3-phosphoglycerate dehydrogenase